MRPCWSQTPAHISPHWSFAFCSALGIGLVVVGLDALARLFGRFERHKHLAGRLGKRKLAERKFGFLITVFFISTHMSANDLTSLWTAFVSLLSKMEM